MAADKVRNEFIIRLIIPTALMAAALLYWGSLWDARMRQQNLIMIQPVVLIMIPFYLATLWFEVQRYRKERAAAAAKATVAADPNLQTNATRNQLRFMLVAALGVAAFHVFGGLAATVMLIVAGLLVLGERRPAVIAITAFSTTFVLWLVFIQIFGIRMPLFPWS